MGKFVTPEVFLIGYTTIDFVELIKYLEYTGNNDFLESVREAKVQGLSDGEILVSLYAKLCYKSLTLGQNKNISRVRDIPDNLRACFDAGHGSVFQHAQLNFVITNCSRVLTHEIVRNVIGCNYSQTSGRYVRGEELDIVFDPILNSVKQDFIDLQDLIERRYKEMVDKIGLDDMKDFFQKKKITSALRRILPNGQSNEIGFSCNLRAIRHIVQLRTSRHAEWEIRFVFAKIYNLLKDKFPLLFYGAKEEVVDGILEITGMKMQPY